MPKMSTPPASDTSYPPLWSQDHHPRRNKPPVVIPSCPPDHLPMTVAVLGARCAGKTAISERLVQNTFDESRYSPTIENEHRMNFTVDDATFELTILDTAGQSECGVLNSSYIIGVDAFMLTFRVTSIQSFRVAVKVNERLMTTFSDTRKGTGNIVRALVATHIDLVGVGREVSEAEARAYAESEMIPYFEVSAKTGQNVRKPFHELLSLSFANWNNRLYEEDEPTSAELVGKGATDGAETEMVAESGAGAVGSRRDAAAAAAAAAAGGGGHGVEVAPDVAETRDDQGASREGGLGRGGGRGNRQSKEGGCVIV